MYFLESKNDRVLIQLARCKFKVSGVKFVGIRPTQIYYQLKKIFEYVKDLFYGSHSRNFLAPVVNCDLYSSNTIGEHRPSEKEGGQSL